MTGLDETGTLKIILVRNSDLPTYVHHGIAGLGVAGDDVVYESGHEFTHLLPLAFGGFGMALAARKDHVRDEPPGHLTIATSYTRFTRDYFHGLGIPVASGSTAVFSGAKAGAEASPAGPAGSGTTAAGSTP